MKKRRLYQPAHPFNECSFEATCCGSWHDVKSIDIRDGAITVHFANQGHGIDEKGPFKNLRLKSRQATLADCTCVLRPGMDVCVHLPLQDTDHLDEEDSGPVWLDAKIRSIERKPHECQCSCQYFVSCYVNQGPLGMEKATLSKKTEAVGINQISVLQRIEALPCEGQFYRWDFSEDCPSVQKTKLFLGKFSSDLTWLLVTSSLKHAAFVVRSVQSKIVYEILDGEDNQSNKHRHALNFKVENDVLTPVVHQFVLDDTNEVVFDGDPHGNELMPLNVDVNLRRSKRRNVQPERFLGCDIVPGTDFGWVRSFPIKYDKGKEDELHLPLSYVFGSKENWSDKQNKEVSLSMLKPSEYCPASKTKSRHTKSNVVHKQEHQTQHSIAPVPEETNSAAFKSNSLLRTPDAYCRETREKISFGYVHKKKSAAEKWNGDFELEDMVVRSSWKGNFVSKKASVGRHRPACSKTEDSCEQKMYRKAPLSAIAYNKLINSFMKNIDSTRIAKEEPRVIDQWEQFKAKNLQDEAEKVDPTDIGDDEECSEIEMLWREMEICLASAYLMEEDEACVTGQNMQKSSECCQHQFKLNEEIGILCHICGFVKTEIKYVSAPFMEFPEWTADYKAFNERDLEHMPDEEEGLNFFDKPATVEDPPLSKENDNVWALIPELRKKLHVHQKQAFEFLWRNIASSLEPARMLKASKKIGGCVISHSPGAGKTFLIIAFLTSFLKLFPGKRPLVLAPKTTLYTWYKEFIKWEIPLPVHLIHGSGSYRRFRDRRTTIAGDLRPGHDVMHILDCLEKIQKWHAQPSVLVMGYTSFLTFMREDSKFTYRKYMAKILRESPGLLILDEGHNPRSTKSRLRKVLMKVETDLRILLSGTLFQNNFCEYFNTLCLARPKFIKEVLRELDPKFRKRRGEGKSQHLLESRARKFFEDHIARKIDSNEGKERLEGLYKLKKITNRFIDVYEGGASEGLPGLQIYTILMNLSESQHNIAVPLQKIMKGVAGYPLELELLITLASIHPWLVTTSNCVRKFFNGKELKELEKYKYDFRKGSKVMFVLNLVYRVIRQEKVLIFCHNIAPINLFIQLFEMVFRWQKGIEIMVLTGDLELFERGRVIDKFEEPGGPSRVLLASITACAEGISLTAASRVVLLDSEWNPSKTKQAIARAFRRGQQKMVYVYQLLATGTLEEDKYRRTTWKDWVSRMIFSEEYVEDPSRWQAEKIEDEVLREMVAEDKVKSFHMIMKNEMASIDQKNL